MQPEEDFVSVFIKIWIRNDHGRSQGSQSRILYHLELNKKRPQEEVRQPEKHFASKLNRTQAEVCYRKNDKQKTMVLQHLASRIKTNQNDLC